MRGFEGFVRRAVVIVPTDEELKSRTAKLEAEEGKDVPDSAILEMKGLFLRLVPPHPLLEVPGRLLQKKWIIMHY